MFDIISQIANWSILVEPFHIASYLQSTLILYLVDIHLAAPKPLPPMATLLEATALEKLSAGHIIGCYICPYLAHTERLATILLNLLDNRARIALTAVRRVVDEYSDAKTEVLRVEVEDVERAHCHTIALDNEAHLARGVDIVALLLDKAHQTLARQWSCATTYAPHLWVVLPYIQLLDVVGLHSPKQTSILARRRHRLQTYYLVTYKHCHTPGIGTIVHLRHPEFSILIHQIERILVCRRLKW